MNDIESKILDILKQYTYGLTISELSRIVKVNRITLSKHLEILKEKGYIGYRNVGKAKVWYINQDINFLELIYTDSQLNKLLKLNQNFTYELGDMKFLILPSEFLQIVYLELHDKDINIVRNLGKKFGITIGATYKIYSGNKIILKEDMITNIIKLYEKMGFGKMNNIEINIKDINIKIEFEYLLENDIIKDTLDVLDNRKIQIKNYFTEGYFEGLLSTIFNLNVVCKEINNMLLNNKEEFLIIRK